MTAGTGTPAPSYKAVSGIRLETVGELWVAYSPLGGQTHVLNTECAAILESLIASGRPASSEDLADEFSGDAGIAAAELTTTIDLAWVPLLIAGLVRPDGDPEAYAATP